MNATRILSLAAAFSVGLASSAGAQSIATFGSAEVAGFGEGSALIGSSISAGRLGWGPVASLVAQTYRYRNGLTSHAQAFALSPSLGLVHTTEVGAVQAGLGYTFVSTEFQGVQVGNEIGGRNGVFASAMGNYWGTGENTAQWLGSYGFASEYFWTRGRAAHRLAPTEHPVYVGGELVFQGTQKAPTAMRYQFGPTIEYRVSPAFRVGASGGYRGGNKNAIGTGYARVEFLLLTKLSGM